jgi:hypothetical protein
MASGPAATTLKLVPVFESVDIPFYANDVLEQAATAAGSASQFRADPQASLSGTVA